MDIPRLVASCGNLGFLTKVPGTLASAVAMVIGYFIAVFAAPWVLVPLSLLVLGLGFWACLRLPERNDDPGWACIDEVAGQWFAMAFAPATAGGALAAFALFRLFDIAKPWPVSWADRKKGAFGIMMDDMLAGAMAALVMVLGMLVL